MTEKMTDDTVSKWVDLTAICTRFNRNSQQVGNIARYYCRYVAADTISQGEGYANDFEIEGVTIRKVGKGKLARYRVIPNPHSL